MATYRQKQKRQKQRRKGKKRRDEKPPTVNTNEYMNVNGRLVKRSLTPEEREEGKPPEKSWARDQWQSAALNGRDKAPEKKEPVSTEREEKRDRWLFDDPVESSLRPIAENVAVEKTKQDEHPYRDMIIITAIGLVLSVAFIVYAYYKESEKSEQKNPQTERITKDGGK